MCLVLYFFFFFFNDTATTEIYTLSLHDALPIFSSETICQPSVPRASCSSECCTQTTGTRSEEHTSELQSQSNLVCRLLLEKKKKNKTQTPLLAVRHRKPLTHRHRHADRSRLTIA